LCTREINNLLIFYRVIENKMLLSVMVVSKEFQCSSRKPKICFSDVRHKNNLLYKLYNYFLPFLFLYYMNASCHNLESLSNNTQIILLWYMVTLTSLKLLGQMIQMVLHTLIPLVFVLHAFLKSLPSTVSSRKTQFLTHGVQSSTWFSVILILL